MASGDRIGYLIWGGAYDGASSIGYNGAISAYATENWTASARGTEVIIQTTDNGSTGRNNRLTVKNDGTVEISKNLKITTSGKGIDFSATSGTGTSELLDDYEEGVFVPVGFGITYSTASGVYTKIGNTVIWSAIVTFPTTADTNVARVTLPFAVAAGNDNRGNCSIGYQDGPVTNLTALHSAGVSYLSFYVGGSAQTNANLSADTIFLGGSYQV
jgi:hypothetical protein